MAVAEGLEAPQSAAQRSWARSFGGGGGRPTGPSLRTRARRQKDVPDAARAPRGSRPHWDGCSGGVGGAAKDRKRVVWGKSVGLGGRRIIKKKTKKSRRSEGRHGRSPRPSGQQAALGWL